MRRVMSERRIATIRLGRRIKISKATLDAFIEDSTRPANGNAAPGLVSLSTKARTKARKKRRASLPERTRGAGPC